MTAPKPIPRGTRLGRLACYLFGHGTLTVLFDGKEEGTLVGIDMKGIRVLADGVKAFGPAKYVMCKRCGRVAHAVPPPRKEIEA